MKLIVGILLLLVTTDFTLSRKASSRKKEYDRKSIYKDEKRITALQELISKQNTSILEFDNQLFTRFAIEGPRDYSLILLFTSETPSFDCPSCGRLLPILKDVAERHKLHIKRDYGRSELFFVKAELSRCQEIFHLLRNQLPTLPQLVHISRTPKQRSLHWTRDDTFPIESSNFDYKTLVLWVTQKTSVKIPLDKSSSDQFLTITLFLMLVLMVSREIPSILSKWRQPLFWFALSVVACGIVVCGTVYNMIRNPPLLWHDARNGRFVFLYPGVMNQFILEGFLATGVLGLGCYGFFLAATYEPSARGNTFGPKTSVYLYVSMMFVSYLWTMSLIRLKLSS